MFAQSLFITTVVFMFIHELDAIQQEEWRFFFGAIRVRDEIAYQLFTALHVPLFILILWNLSALWFQIGFDIFMLIHAVLHIILRKHPHVNFNNFFSRIWIFGGAILGLLHLVLVISSYVTLR